MLVLSRETNERIVVGGVVRITVVEIRGGEVRIAIEAPAGVTIVCDAPSTPPDRPNDESPNGA
jgi:carbon storage regulator CsrA